MPETEDSVVSEEPKIVGVVGLGEGGVYSPDEVPPGLNMTLEAWQALSDNQRQMYGDVRFHHGLQKPDGDPR